MNQYRVGIIGATGMVGQRFISLLKDHPWFKVTCLAASARSAGKTYREAVGERWAFDWPIPDYAADMTIVDASDIDAVAAKVDFCFCAVDMKKDEIRALEEDYARHEVPIVSNNSACRGIEDVPMVVPEINAAHLDVIPTQRKRLGSKYGFIAVKPNCSIQSYVPALTPLLDFEPTQVSVCTYQAISGAGKTFKTWPEMVDNVIPYIGGEDEKSENEPLKLWGTVKDLGNGPVIVNAAEPVISAQCLRVAASDGHMAAVSVNFRNDRERWVIHVHIGVLGFSDAFTVEKFRVFYSLCKIVAALVDVHGDARAERKMEIVAQCGLKKMILLDALELIPDIVCAAEISVVVKSFTELSYNLNMP